MKQDVRANLVGTCGLTWNHSFMYLKLSRFMHRTMSFWVWNLNSLASPTGSAFKRYGKQDSNTGILPRNLWGASLNFHSKLLGSPAQQLRVGSRNFILTNEFYITIAAASPLQSLFFFVLKSALTSWNDRKSFFNKSVMMMMMGWAKVLEQQ